MVDCPQISDLGPVLVLHQTLCCSTEMNSHFENWSDVRFFLAVFRHGSTLAASKKLGVAQPTVSRRIDALESEIGLALFDRGSRGVRPTDCAKALLASAEEMERVAEKFEQKLEQLRKPRTIRITAPGNFSEQVMDIFSAFSAKNPDVGFEFIHSIKVLDLASGEADIAIRLTKEEQDQNLICRKIRDAKWALFGSTSYSQKFGLPKSEDELGGHRFVTFQNASVPDYLHQWLVARVKPQQIVASFLDTDLMKAAVRSGQGLGLVNLRQAKDDSGLIRCFGDIDDLTRQHLILISPEAYRRPEVKKFTKFFAPRYAATFKE